MGIYHEVVLYIDPLMLSQFLKLHSVQQTFVNPIGNAAAECCGVIVFFDFPYRYWIYSARKSPVNTRASVRSGASPNVTVVN